MNFSAIEAINICLHFINMTHNYKLYSQIPNCPNLTNILIYNIPFSPPLNFAPVTYNW